VVVVTDIDDIRREHVQDVIGELITALLVDVVGSIAPTYPPGEYSPAGVWNVAAIDDVMQDWVMARLLERGDLRVMISSARDVRALRAVLTRSLRQHLINSRRRTSATNLYTRMIKALRGGAFAPVGSSRSPALQAWTLNKLPHSAPAGPDIVSRMIKLAYGRTDAELGVVRYGPYSLKSSPILRDSQLHEFLKHLLAEADGYVTAAELFQVMRHRFNLVELPQRELDELAADPGASVSLKVERRLLASSVLAQLGGPAAALIRAIEEAGGDLIAAASARHVPLSAVAEANDRLQALIAEYAESADEAVAIRRQLIESLYGEDDSHD
jgi:hypothetical protein